MGRGGAVGARLRGRDLIVAALLVMSLAHAIVDEACAQPGNGSVEARAETLPVFDLPALPLDEALNRYAEITGYPAIFPSDLLVGRRSSAVQGAFAPESALQMLLQGTGLHAVRRGSGRGSTFVLKAVAGPGNGTGSIGTPLFAGNAYAGAAQASIWRSLCGDPLTRPGSYTALLRFRIDGDGRVSDAALLDGTGNPARDAALVRRLMGVRVPGTAPARLQREALTMVVLPSDPGGPQCDVGQGER